MAGMTHREERCELFRVEETPRHGRRILPSVPQTVMDVDVLTCMYVCMCVCVCVCVCVRFVLNTFDTACLCKRVARDNHTREKRGKENTNREQDPSRKNEFSPRSPCRRPTVGSTEQSAHTMDQRICCESRQTVASNNRVVRHRKTGDP